MNALALPVAMVAVAASFLTLVVAAPPWAARVDVAYAIVMLALTVVNLHRERGR